MKAILVFFLFSIICVTAKSQTAISLASVNDTTICGDVVDTHWSASDGTIFLNLGDAFPNQTFTVVIPGSDAGKFTTDYKGESICVTGRLELYKGKREIVVSEPKQIKRASDMFTPRFVDWHLQW
ncbi:MAG TPA: hypothetical protein VE978_20270 [Chitinophagales bacterium]|nr:hypothetical protein [Chitinophagales bacterium]